MEYRTVDELRKYGSDYNKWLHYHCRPDMTVIDIDCVQWDYNKRILRLVESKHKDEITNRTSHQFKLLRFLALMLRQLNKTINTYTFELYIVTGDYPYDTLIVENLITHTKQTLTGDEVKKFTNMEMSV